MAGAYLTNRQLAARGLDAMAPGVEEILDGRGRVHVAFWHGFFVAGRILDRTTGQPAARQTVALVWRDGDRWAYRMTPGPRGAIRYGRAASEQDALAHVRRWVRRRFAHCTPLAEAGQ